MIRIAGIYPNISDATSWYRGQGVMGNLYKVDPRINHYSTEIVHWCICKEIDVLYMQRPVTPNQIKCIEMAKKCNVKVWVDYDDLITGAKEHNPYFKIMKNKTGMTKHHIKENIDKCLELADLVTVPTEYLQEKFKDKCKWVKVVENAHDDYFMPMPDNQPLNESNIVLWRGSESHKDDLIEFESEIIGAIEANPQLEFYFFGYRYRMFEKYKNVHFINQVNDLLGYWETCIKLKPRYSIIPLADNDFNKSKSNIAALEAIYFGAMPLCPSWDQWHGLGLYYNLKEDFSKSFNQMVNVTDDNLYQATLNTMKNYALSSINYKRKILIDILKETK